ncbi:hypothetical protein PG2072B_0936 [Bifidobacterium pseudolongum subsp. globosum]|uniref:Uncharacterized protein n=1 Tax=Bifidobacterium pseudolongum subsp. globosum TaxID=1690 RepID=A0A4Q5BBT6_9BIFI|nr:hypothetical protein [Bifidobacterium pseudolongum]MCH4849898.1 hypothetical protein [Bifidobacterium pseudolongum]RYQ68333.1 hypothetical protein PG2072B_0936 [Bifidobacterium pseudolongum subsp. globosum]
MATIHIKLANAVDGGTSPCEGKVRFIPIRRYNRGDTVIVPKPFEVTLADGEANATIIDTDTMGCWAVTELPGTPQEYTRYVQVPTTSETLEYTDLIDVNPSTLLPTTVTAGPLLQIALAADAQAALAYSRTHPETLVLYSEEESINAMAATVSEIAAVRTAVQTQANHATGAARTAVVAAEAATQNLQHIEDTAKQIGVMAGAIIDAAGNNGETSPSTGQTQDTPVQEDPAAGKGEE